jgi:hypothetical protein
MAPNGWPDLQDFYNQTANVSSHNLLALRMPPEFWYRDMQMFRDKRSINYRTFFGGFPPEDG